jgi:hypothetical protein
VRVRYRATAEQARRVDQQAIRRAVHEAGAHKLYAVQPDIVRTGRARVEGADESMDEREAMYRWLVSQGINDFSDQAAAVVDRHADYLEAVRG